tara:strand:+ start:1013 stop:1120 length:108 start_codon:yes stop_codon:yes gene_type:complete
MPRAKAGSKPPQIFRQARKLRVMLRVLAPDGAERA